MINQDWRSTVEGLQSEDVMSAALAHIATELGQADDVDGIPMRLVEAVIRSTPFDQCWAGVFDLQASEWVSEYIFSAGFDAETRARWELRRNWVDDAEPSIVAIRTEAPVIIPDVMDAPQFSKLSERSISEGYRASIYIPVRLSEDEWTVMSLHRSVAHQFTESEQSLAAAIATFAAIAFRNAIARDKAIDAYRTANETVTLQNELLQHMANVHQRLLQAQLRGGGIDAICEILATLLHSPVILLDRFQQVIAHIGVTRDEAAQLSAELAANLRQSLDSLVDKGSLLVNVGEREILVGIASDGHTIMGTCIAIPQGQFGPNSDASTLELGCLYISLELSHQRAAIEAELRQQNDFVSALVRGGEAELTRRSSVLGIDMNSPRRVFRARVRGMAGRLARTDSAELADYVRRRLLQMTVGAVAAATKPYDFVFVLPDGPGIDEATSAIRAILKDGLSALTFTPTRAIAIAIGIGEVGAGISGLATSQSGATRALEVLDASHQFDADLFIGNAGSSALLTIPPDEQKQDFVDQYLSALLEHDRSSGSELMVTLRTYFAQVGNVKRTADVMFLHISTVRHRLGRIEKIAGVSLKNEDERLCLQLALRLADITNP